MCTKMIRCYWLALDHSCRDSPPTALPPLPPLPLLPAAIPPLPLLLPLLLFPPLALLPLLLPPLPPLPPLATLPPAGHVATQSPAEMSMLPREENASIPSSMRLNIQVLYNHSKLHRKSSCRLLTKASLKCEHQDVLWTKNRSSNWH